MAEREHLYRDEGKVALERASRLAEENAELRRELARYRDGRDVPTLRMRRPGVPPAVIAALAASITLLLTGTGIAIVTVAVDEPPPVVIESPVTSTHARAAVTPYERSAGARRSKDDGPPAVADDRAEE